jgi:hypothetical protein
LTEQEFPGANKEKYTRIKKDETLKKSKLVKGKNDSQETN